MDNKPVECSHSLTKRGYLNQAHFKDHYKATTHKKLEQQVLETIVGDLKPQALGLALQQSLSNPIDQTSSKIQYKVKSDTLKNISALLSAFG